MRGLAWRLLERRLARSIDPRRLGPLLGDLAADYEHVIRTRGRYRARLWLLGESLSLLWAYRAQAPTKRGHMDRLRLDAIHAWRALRARPAATLATVGVLALGIGLVSSMFALADPYVTRALPFQDASRLVSLSVTTSMRPAGDLPSLDSWSRRTDLFGGLCAVGSSEALFVVAPSGDAALRLLPVSREYLSVLGTAGPALFDWHDRPQFTEAPVVLTAAAARRLGRFGAEGARLSIIDDKGAPTGRGYRVRGSLPASFLFPSSWQEFDGLVPVADGTPLVALERTPSGFVLASPRLSVVARLQPGVNAGQVAAALSTAPPLEDHIMPVRGYAVSVLHVPELVTQQLRPLATGALVAGILILLVCATNVANLLIARGALRAREFATRESLGASRLDLGRLVLVELAMTTTLGIGAGLALAGAVLSAVSTIIPARYVVLGAPDISARVVWFACAAGGVVMIAGLLPALAAWRLTPRALFQQVSSGQPRGLRLARISLTAAQTAVAVVFLVGAMLMARSYVKLVLQDPGYAGDAFAVGVRYPTQATARVSRADVETTAERLRHVDHVTGVAIAVGPLVENISGGGGGAGVIVDGVKVGGLVKRVSANFFQTAGGRLLDGRLLAPADEKRAAVVSGSFARLCCGEQSPIGLRAEWNDRSIEIVGVVADVFDQALDRAPLPAMFMPIDDSMTDVVWVTYLLRVDRPTASLTTAIDREIHLASRQASIADGGLMRDRLLRSIRARSFATLIVIFFALAAIGVSAAGIVGVVGSVVARRTREIAIRMALGAGTSDVRRLVTSEAVLASGIGAVAGLILGGWLSTTMKSLLFGVSPADPVSIVLAGAALVVIVAAAAWVPARRAVRLSPTEALRVE